MVVGAEVTCIVFHSWCSILITDRLFHNFSVSEAVDRLTSSSVETSIKGVQGSKIGKRVDRVVVLPFCWLSKEERLEHKNLPISFSTLELKLLKFSSYQGCPPTRK